MTEKSQIEQLKISTLGGLVIKRGDKTLRELVSRKAEALLVYLAMTRQQLQREVLADLLWDDRSQKQALSNLRTVLASLREHLGDYVSISRHTVSLQEGNNTWIDALELEKAIQESQHKGGVFWLSEARALGDTIDLYEGDFLQGFSVRECRDFEGWMLVEREHLHQLVLAGLENLVDYHITRGSYQAGISKAQRWVQLNPIMEVAHQKLMRLLVYAGRKAAALEQFEACSRILETELGLEPAIETRELYAQILSAELVIPATNPIHEPIVLTRPPAFLKENIEDHLSLPVFIGRQRQLERLTGCLKSALRGDGQVSFVTGGPGRGKTALLGEFTRCAMDAYPDLLVVMGKCNAYEGIGDHYLPFREILGMLCGDVESLWEAETITTNHARRLWASLPGAADALLEYGPHLLGAFIPPEELLARAELASSGDAFRLGKWREGLGKSRSTQTGVEQSHLFEQFTNVLSAIARNHPLLLLLDDLHWADNTSTALLFHIGRRLKGARILIVAAYRPEEIALGRNGDRHPLEKVLNEFKLTFGDVWMDLGGLDQTESRAFVSGYVDTEQNRLGDGFREALYQQTGGHPLFTIELLREMQDRGDLVRDPSGAWIENRPLDWSALPARVEAVIQERIGRLDREYRDLLSIASIEGETFTAQVLARVGQVDESQLLALLSSELQKRHRLIKPEGTQVIGDQQLSLYRFNHILFQQFLYHDLGPVLRRKLHREIGLSLEALYKGSENEIAVQLARHFRGDLERERKYASLAAERAAARFANDEALHFFNRALELTPAETFEERFDLLLGRENLFFLQGNRAAQKGDLKNLKELAETLDDNQKKIEVFLRQARFSGKTSDYPSTIANAKNAVRMAEIIQDIWGQAEGYLRWGLALWALGDHKAAKEKLAHSLELSRAAGHKQVEAHVLRISGAFSNDFDDLNNLHQALEVYRQLGDLAGESKVFNNLGARACHGLAEFGKARSYLEDGLAISRKIGFRDGEMWLISNLAELYNYVGDYSTSLGYIQQSYKIAIELGDKETEAWSLKSFGEHYARQGAYPKAKAYFEQSLEMARQIGVKEDEIESLGFLSLLHHHIGDHQAALECAQEVLRLAQEMDDFIAFAWKCLGFAYEGMDILKEAAIAYSQAYEISLSYNQPHIVAEHLAGLARVSLAQGNQAQAQTHVAEILDFMDRKISQMSASSCDGLETASPFDGTFEPFTIYVTCYRVLKACGDPRAEEILRSAYDLLQARAANIQDEDLRASYLNKVPPNKEIIHHWAAREAS